LLSFFADIFQEKPIDNGFPSFAKYLRAFNIYEPKVIGCAFLVTLVLLHQKGWRVRRLGALFNKQCEILTGQKPLTHYTLDEVEEWLQTWGQVPYAELIEMLTQAPQIWRQREPSTLISSPFSSEEERSPARLSNSHSNQFDIEHAEAITAILEDEMQETIAGREPGQTEEQGQSFVLEGRMSPRSEEQRKERERYARKVRRQLVEAHVVVVQRDGTCGLEIDREHRCGCPLYRQNGLRHRCAHCIPDLSWSQEVNDLIATILDA